MSNSGRTARVWDPTGTYFQCTPPGDDKLRFSLRTGHWESDFGSQHSWVLGARELLLCSPSLCGWGTHGEVSSIPLLGGNSASIQGLPEESWMMYLGWPSYQEMIRLVFLESEISTYASLPWVSSLPAHPVDSGLELPQSCEPIPSNKSLPHD